MRFLKTYESFQQPEGTGKDSFWEKEVDGEIQRINLNDVLDYLDNGVEIEPEAIKHLLIDTKRDEQRIESSDLKYPIILVSSGGEITSILDGQHRVVKALQNGEKVKARVLDLDTSPQKFKDILLNN